MGMMYRISELLLKGAIASYLLLYAFEFHTQPQVWEHTISLNLVTYAEYFGVRTDQIRPFIASWLMLYSKWLVLVSAFVMMGLRSGRIFGCLSMLLTLILCWNDTQWLFLGVNLVLYGTLYG